MRRRKPRSANMIAEVTMSDENALNREQRRHPEQQPPMDPDEQNNPALSEQPKDSYAGRADQDVTANTGTGAGGATEYGGGNKNHPSRVSRTPGGGQRP
jgi:hypothetical protein